MSRISECFAAAKAAGRKVLIPYVTAGDPAPTVTVPLMHAMVEAGADLIELGVPFSDPMAEGPVIQKAMERALEHHVTMDDVLAMVKTFREKDEKTPVVIMGYLNPIEVKGYEAFAKQASAAGVDGILTVDIPPEEAGDYIQAMKNNELDRIFLVSPTTSDARIKSINAASSGFIYYVSLKGVTGAGHLDTGLVKERVDHIASMSNLPVGVGFGIKDAETAAAISNIADAVVVGSALVKRVEEHADSADAINKSVAALISEMRQAMDANN